MIGREGPDQLFGDVSKKEGLFSVGEEGRCLWPPALAASGVRGLLRGACCHDGPRRGQGAVAGHLTCMPVVIKVSLATRGGRCL